MPIKPIVYGHDSILSYVDRTHEEINELKMRIELLTNEVNELREALFISQIFTKINSK